ncbi:hypothetical protein O9929_16705 [Vibrio lentus]|nr:hypothetical protein [Vibrio lentus]
MARDGLGLIGAGARYVGDSTIRRQTKCLLHVVWTQHLFSTVLKIMQVPSCSEESARQRVRRDV